MDRYGETYSLTSNSFAWSVSCWSSLEYNADNAWYFNFDNGQANNNNKNNTKQVRAVRASSIKIIPWALRPRGFYF